MKNVFLPQWEWNIKHSLAFIGLLILPNVLSLINIGTPWGFKIHFFQLGIILAAFLYGPLGGLGAGLIGSIYPAMMMHNPYIIGGNAILGLAIGIFAFMNINKFLAVGLAFLIQLPWLILTDYYLIGMPMNMIIGIIIALTLSNALWTAVSYYTYKPLQHMLK